MNEIKMPKFEKVCILFERNFSGSEVVDSVIEVVPLICQYDSPEEETIAKKLVVDNGADYYKIVPLNWSLLDI